MNSLKTRIDFGIRGSSLLVERISSLLGLSPTSAFNPHEKYIGKSKVGDAIVSVERNRPSFGVWHFSTENKVDSDCVEDHARFLINILVPAKHGIEKLLQSSEYELRLSIWYVGSNGFDISAKAMAQLATICANITVRCFEPVEAASDA